MHSIRTLMTNKKLMAIAFVLLGGIIISVYSWRSYRAYQQWQYIQTEKIDRGEASVGAIRPWMTMRYVSVAYAVPQEYIFAELDIPYNRRNSNDTLGHLAHVYEDLPHVDANRIPVLVIKVSKVIQTYRENPVAIGLKDIRSWMTIEYIGNSTGISIDYLFRQLQITADGNNEFKPLNYLAREVDFPGGDHRLINVIKESLSQYQGEQ